MGLRSPLPEHAFGKQSPILTCCEGKDAEKVTFSARNWTIPKMTGSK